MLMLNNDLHIFITAAQTGSLTEAAKKLYVSQLEISREELSYAYIENVEFRLRVLLGTEIRYNKDNVTTLQRKR